MSSLSQTVSQSTNLTSWATVEAFLEKSDSQTVDCFHQTQWDELCLIASSHAGGQMKCMALDHVANGLNNIVRLLEFSDGSRCVARVHIRRNTSLLVSKNGLSIEIATMQFIKEHSKLPVPRVFAYAVDENNSVGAAFILMELIPGCAAMDAYGGLEVHHGLIPREYRQTFYRSVAKCHVQLTSLRLPKIGSIVWNKDGGYKCGPLPGIGGPFKTATAFFEAWADTVKFKRDKEEISGMMQGAPISLEEMLTIIENFPSQVKAMAGRLSSSDTDKGPFPLCHDDFFHSNIMVDENTFDVTAIIDWDGACTVPWELIAFPNFLLAMPISFDLPQNYDQYGQPVDRELQETWREQGEYIEMVRAVELEDTMLSSCLRSKRSQSIAYTYGAYTSMGKLGYYNRVIEELEKEK